MASVANEMYSQTYNRLHRIDMSRIWTITNRSVERDIGQLDDPDWNYINNSRNHIINMIKNIENIIRNYIERPMSNIIVNMITTIIRNYIEGPMNDMQNNLFDARTENDELYRQLNLQHQLNNNNNNQEVSTSTTSTTSTPTTPYSTSTTPIELECEVCDLSKEALCSQITELTYEIEDYRNAASTETTCCICFDKPRIFINTHCGHLTSCISCVHQLNNQCPICRKVGQFIKIIVA